MTSDARPASLNQRLDEIEDRIDLRCDALDQTACDFEEKLDAMAADLKAIKESLSVLITPVPLQKLVPGQTFI